MSERRRSMLSLLAEIGAPKSGEKFAELRQGLSECGRPDRGCRVSLRAARGGASAAGGWLGGGVTARIDSRANHIHGSHVKRMNRRQETPAISEPILGSFLL